jgi:flagellar motor switch protein FliM
MVEVQLSISMAPNWTQADFKTNGRLQGVPGELLRAAHELLGKELGFSLSAFLRCSVSTAYTGGEEVPFGDLQKEPENQSCMGLARIQPDERKLVIEIAYPVLFPLIGVALGAKAGSFAQPERKPTDLEIQVVNILYRLILAEAYRAWAPLVKTQLETVALDIEQPASRPFQPTDPVFAARFEVTIGEHVGQLLLVVPPDLFTNAPSPEQATQREASESASSSCAAMQLMLPAKVSLDVWLDGSQMKLRDLLQLSEGQIVKLDHPVERKAICTLNGKSGFSGQIVSTGSRRAFQVEESFRAQS